LSAVIEYLENMNGELIIESEPEKGALVIVKLPKGDN
jgi:signal transduction histidine kinase